MVCKQKALNIYLKPFVYFDYTLVRNVIAEYLFFQIPIGSEIISNLVSTK